MSWNYSGAALLRALVCNKGTELRCLLLHSLHRYDAVAGGTRCQNSTGKHRLIIHKYNWDKELLSAYTEFMAKIKLFQSDAENEFNTWFESIKDKLGEDIAGSLQLQIEELAAAMQEVKKQAEAGTKETKEAIAALDERLKRVESGWGICLSNRPHTRL